MTCIRRAFLQSTGCSPTRRPPQLRRLLQNLNPEQLAAVATAGAAALILAGAGSGKTRVLTTRIAWLLQTGQVSPGGVLAVTFTNKAAKEMLTRLSAMLPVNVRGMWIGTFHGLCNRFLRAHWKLASLPQSFQILDTQDQLSADQAHDQGDEPRRRALRRPSRCSWFIAGAKEDGLRPRDVEIARRADAQAGRDLPGLRRAVPARRRGRLRRADAAQLRTAARQRRRCASTTSGASATSWSTSSRTPTGCSTRGSRCSRRRRRPRARRGRASSRSATTTRASTPFAARGSATWPTSSASSTCSSSHQAGAELPQLRQHPRLRQRADQPQRAAPGQEPAHRRRRRASRCASTSRPATSPRRSGCSRRCASCTATASPRNEIALLYRSNAQSRVIESALFNAGMPYRVYGGLRFFERAEVKHALAYLRLLENPNDDTSFLRVVNFPPRGIGARSIEQLQDAARGQRPQPGAERRRGAAARPARNLPAFVALIDVHARARRTGMTLREIIEQVLDAQRPDRLLQRRQGRRGPHREPGRTGQCRRELRHAGRLRQGRGGAAGGRTAAVPASRAIAPAARGRRRRSTARPTPRPARPCRRWPPS